MLVGYTELRPVGLLAALILVGVTMFFFPMMSLDRMLLQARHGEQDLIRAEIGRLVKSSPDPEARDPGILLSELKSAMALDLARQEIVATPTWPFDTTILSRLAAIAITVTTLIIAQLVIIQLSLR